MALRERLRELLEPEASPEPALRYREGVPALTSFAYFVLLLAPLGAALFAIADSEAPPLWIVPPAVGLPAFVCAFLLPRRRRRLVALVVTAVYIAVAVMALVLAVLILIAISDCPDGSSECLF